MARAKVKTTPRRSVPGKEHASRVAFYHAWCKHCGICIAFCPKEALGVDDEGDPQLVRPELCNACGLCQVLCPDFAITVPRGARKTE